VSVPGDPDRPFAFRPSELTVPAGTTVRWVNNDAVFHTVTSTNSLERKRPNGLLDRSVFARGQAVQYRFTRPGTYHYYCRPHSEFMAGTVRVTG
jgi:plastocyanin